MAKSYNVDKTKNKRFVQALNYNKVGINFNSDALVLLGTEPTRAINDTFEYVCTQKHNKIISYETEMEHYEKQTYEIDKHTLRDRIIPNFDNVSTAEPCRYIDLDFTGVLYSSYGLSDIITNLFNKQIKRFPNERKIFTFTVSNKSRVLNEIGKIEIYDFLNKLLKSNVSQYGEDIHMSKGVKCYQTITNDKKYLVDFYYYFDSYNMFTIFIQSHK